MLTVERAQEEAARVGNGLVTKTGRFAETAVSANPLICWSPRPDSNR